MHPPLDLGQASEYDAAPMSEPDPSPEGDILFALIRQRYGDRLTAEQLETLRKGVEALVEAAASLRAVRLRNSDEPFQPFVPFRADG